MRISIELIPVTERLPEKSGYYLAFNSSPLYGFYSASNISWDCERRGWNLSSDSRKTEVLDVTHWCEMPTLTAVKLRFAPEWEGNRDLARTLALTPHEENLIKNLLDIMDQKDAASIAQVSPATDIHGKIAGAT